MNQGLLSLFVILLIALHVNSAPIPKKDSSSTSGRSASKISAKPTTKQVSNKKSKEITNKDLNKSMKKWQKELPDEEAVRHFDQAMMPLVKKMKNSDWYKKAQAKKMARLAAKKTSMEKEIV